MLELDRNIISLTGASKINRIKSVQSLWSGYGEIKKYYLEGGNHASVIVKHIQLPDADNHPKGWNTKLSHQRKLKSYQVEKHWYNHFVFRTNAQCRVPSILQGFEKEQEILLVMEDLDASGYDVRLDPQSVTLDDAKRCLTWLAHFHATFMDVASDGLWAVGTYWHLKTRPDELSKMKNMSLKKAAHQIDDKLNNSKFQTLVHGDAKLANFCFSKSGSIAAVDFQYVGKGCGMKDIAYLIGSCFNDQECEIYESELLSHYFSQLKIALNNSADYQSIKDEWMLLYKYAWADFYRFLDGWSSTHWKMHSYSAKLTQQVINELVS